MQFPEEGLVYDYMLDDAGIFTTAPSNLDEEDIEIKKVMALLLFFSYSA